MGGRGETWRWRRRLWEWEWEEELLEEYRILLVDVSLQPLYFDVWQWLPDPDGGYSVRGAYAMLTAQETQHDGQDVDLIWHKQVPLKVSIFAWRMLHDRLPTKSNLEARGVIGSEVCLCMSGCGLVEDARHLFLACSWFGSIGPLLWSWIGFDGVDHYIISDHLLQFTY